MKLSVVTPFVVLLLQCRVLFGWSDSSEFQTAVLYSINCGMSTNTAFISQLRQFKATTSDEDARLSAYVVNAYIGFVIVHNSFGKYGYFRRSLMRRRTFAMTLDAVKVTSKKPDHWQFWASRLLHTLALRWSGWSSIDKAALVSAYDFSLHAIEEGDTMPPQMSLDSSAPIEVAILRNLGYDGLSSRSALYAVGAHLAAYNGEGSVFSNLVVRLPAPFQEQTRLSLENILMKFNETGGWK